MNVRPTLGGILGGAILGRIGGSGPAHMLTLELASNRPFDGTPSAEHLPPPGLEAGQSLPLLTPAPATPGREGKPGEPSAQEKPRGRILIFWGCAEAARPGQPMILDVAKLASGAFGPQTKAYVEMSRRMQGAMRGMSAAAAAQRPGVNRARYKPLANGRTSAPGAASSAPARSSANTSCGAPTRPKSASSFRARTWARSPAHPPPRSPA